MSQQEFLRVLQDRGLRSWQANFIAAFLESNSAAFHTLSAPPGTGKSFTSIAIATELASRGARRMLVLAPAPLCEQWRQRLDDAQSKLPVVLVTRRIYRELEAAVRIGECPLNANGIYVISQALLKNSDVFSAITSVVWDVVFVDDAHRFMARQRPSFQNRTFPPDVVVRPQAILEQLVANEAVDRLLLLSAVPLPTLEPWLRQTLDQQGHLQSSIVNTDWHGTLKDWDGSAANRQRLEWSVVSYRRNSDEVKFLTHLLGLMHELESGDGTSFLTQTLTRRAGSSLFAIEQSLERLRSNLEVKSDLDAKVEQIEQDLGPVREISTDQTHRDLDIEEVESTTPVLPVDWADGAATAEMVKQCLDALDCVSADEKLRALKGLIQSIIGSQNGSLPIIFVFAMYADTVSYLHTALEDVGLPLFKLTGENSSTERQATVEPFLREGGVMIGTDAAMEGSAMPQVAHAIQYDLPANPLSVAQRCGRFDRYGRTTPLTMYVLKDESGVLESESSLIDKVISNRDIDADTM